MLRLAILLTALALAACGSSHTDGPDDAGMDAGRRGGGLPDGAVRVDGGVLLPDGRVIPDDAGTIDPDEDAGPGDVDAGDPTMDGRIGTPCTSDDECRGRFCSMGPGGLGYCSWVCADDVPCPDGAVCVFPGGRFGFCLLPCTLDDPTSCPMGTVCSIMGTPEPVCVAGCRSDADCPMGTMCGGGGLGGTGRCFTPSAGEGVACTVNSDCDMRSFCADERNWGFAAGMCLQFGCNPTTGMGCSGTTACVQFNEMGAGICLPRCIADEECRAGYRCQPTPDTMSNVCVPRCTDDSQCTGGRRCDFLTARCVMR